MSPAPGLKPKCLADGRLEGRRHPSNREARFAFLPGSLFSRLINQGLGPESRGQCGRGWRPGAFFQLRSKRPSRARPSAKSKPSAEKMSIEQRRVGTFFEGGAAGGSNQTHPFSAF